MDGVRLRAWSVYVVWWELKWCCMWCVTRGKVEDWRACWCFPLTSCNVHSFPIQNSKFPHQGIHPMTGVQTLSQHRPRTSPGPHFANAERDPLPSSPMGQAAMFLPETLFSISKPLEKREKNGASRHLQRLRQGSGADMPLLPRGHLLLAFLPRHESPTARPDLPNPRNTPTKSQPARATGSRGAVP